MSNQQSLVKKTNSRPQAVMPVLEQEREIMAVAATHHWPFRVLGVAPVPEQPVFYTNWWLVPVAQDSSQIPARALERVQAIYEAGIRPKAFVIAHEAPPQIAPPPNTPTISRLEYWTSQMEKHSLTVVKVAGTVLVAVIAPLALAALTALGLSALFTVGLVGAILTDPCLIAVTEDNVWIQIDFWMA